MKLYISAVFENTGRNGAIKINVEDVINLNNLHILQSFAYAKEEHIEKYKLCKNFLLDSGAFSAMNSKTFKNINIKDYCVQYAEFIKKNNINEFIELDVDGVFGIDVYKDCLHRLQDITGKDPLRVFHVWRGIDYFNELVKQKKRICIGGIAIRLIQPKDYNMFTHLLDIAHKNNCEVHGLGIGSSSVICKYNFDSVDSASWTTSIRNGHLFKFNGHELLKYAGSVGCPNNTHIDTNYVGILALKEWAKYSHYLDTF